MTDNAHATARRLPLPPSHPPPTSRAGYKIASSWTSTHTHTLSHTLPVAIVKYHLSFSQRPSIAVYHPTPCWPLLPTPLPLLKQLLYWVVFRNFSLSCRFSSPPPLAEGKQKRRAGRAEKRMENQFLTSGCYFSCQRFKAVAGAIKAEQ